MNAGTESFALWWRMTEAQAELADEPIPNSAVVLHFMGSGASHQVTAGDIRQMLAANQ